MTTMQDWLKLRTEERHSELKANVMKSIGVVDNRGQAVIPLTHFPAVAIELIAQLQARCDALEVQVESLQGTKH